MALIDLWAVTNMHINLFYWDSALSVIVHLIIQLNCQFQLNFTIIIDKLMCSLMYSQMIKLHACYQIHGMSTNYLQIKYLALKLLFFKLCIFYKKYKTL